MKEAIKAINQNDQSHIDEVADNVSDSSKEKLDLAYKVFSQRLNSSLKDLKSHINPNGQIPESKLEEFFGGACKDAFSILCKEVENTVSLDPLYKKIDLNLERFIHNMQHDFDKIAEYKQKFNL